MRPANGMWAPPTAALILWLSALGCSDESRRPPGPTSSTVSRGTAPRFHFVDVAASAGLARVLHAGRPGKDHLLDSAGAGAAWLDYDRDGWLDAYLVNGWKLSGTEVSRVGKNALYRNRGDGTFQDVTDPSGVDGEGHWGCGVAVADYDDDGWPDILVTNFGPNVLYHNQGDGTFRGVASEVGVEAPGWNTGAAFFDADRDGDLDLYVAAYINCQIADVLKARRTLSWKGVDKVAFGPFGLEGAPDHFFLSDGQGRFSEATAAAGLTDRTLAFGFGVRAVDIDHDEDLDLYVANDSDANYLYRNEGNGTFREVGKWSGAAFDGAGNAQAGMGVTVGDTDGDTHVDLVVTNFSEDSCTLYRGDGQGFFDDVSGPKGIKAVTFPPLSWGTVLADLDSDGDLDLAIANGHIYPQVDRHPKYGQMYSQVDLLLENTGAGKFRNATPEAGPGFAEARCSRGLVAGDYDNDGDLDLLVTVLDSPPRLLRNDSVQGAWLTVICETSQGAPAIGAECTLQVGDSILTRDLASNDSYLGVSDPRLHFGLGSSSVAERLTVRWPDGESTTLENIAARRFLTIRKE